MQYTRNDLSFTRGTFRSGRHRRIHPQYEELAVRTSVRGRDRSASTRCTRWTGEIVREEQEFYIFPAFPTTSPVPERLVLASARSRPS
jgi:excinuclease UvrABC helicase subunit UvrB